MPGTGRVPKAQVQRPATEAKRRVRGDWQPSEGVGWQHGAIPKPPSGLQPAARAAWKGWMESWVAAHWAPMDLPNLYLIAKLYDECHRGKASAAQQSEYRQLCDSYGISPKGQQDRRWKPPEEAPKTAPVASTGKSVYGHLTSVE